MAVTCVFLPTATEAAIQSLEGTLITEEVLLIALNILAAIDINLRVLTVDTNTITYVNGVPVDGTPMTSSDGSTSAYYDVWKGTVVDPIKSGNMNEVIKYFTSRGYSINRKSDDDITMYWYISW